MYDEVEEDWDEPEADERDYDKYDDAPIDDEGMIRSAGPNWSHYLNPTEVPKNPLLCCRLAVKLLFSSVWTVLTV